MNNSKNNTDKTVWTRQVGAVNILWSLLQSILQFDSTIAMWQIVVYHCFAFWILKLKELLPIQKELLGWRLSNAAKILCYQTDAGRL